MSEIKNKMSATAYPGSGAGSSDYYPKSSFGSPGSNGAANTTYVSPARPFGSGFSSTILSPKMMSNYHLNNLDQSNPII